MFACIYSPQIPAELSLAEFAYAFSPLVEETAADTAVIDVEGCALRFGSAYELATQIARQAKAKPPQGLTCRVNVALAANPDLTSTRQYLGEAYLQMDEPAKAKLQLAEIARRCGTSCVDYRDLSTAIAAYETSGKS